MKITLIMPAVGKKPGQPYVRSWLMEPLGLATLAGATPPDIEVAFADDRLDTIPYDAPTDAVALTVESYTARRAYSIAAAFRRRGIPVILGGYHPTLIPDEAMLHADAIVEGPAEAVWPQVLSDLEHRRLRPRYVGQGCHLPPTAAPPRREIYANRKYLPITLLETGRGCHFSCEFCSISSFYRRTAQSRTPAEVRTEIDAAIARTGNRDVFFVDDNIIAEHDRAKALFSALAGSSARWISQGSIDMADDPALLASMRKSGCRGVLIGFESLSPGTLAAMGKGWNRAGRDYATAIARIRDAGIPIYATFVFGYDTDDADAFKRSVDFALEQRFCMAAFNHLVPFPGTPLYSRLKAANRLRHDPWWLSPAFRFGEVAFNPKSMSAEELAARCYRARLDFYRAGSIFSRFWDRKANCGDLRATLTYLWLNLFSGRQMSLRQGLPLGEGFGDEAETLLLREGLSRETPASLVGSASPASR